MTSSGKAGRALATFSLHKVYSGQVICGEAPGPTIRLPSSSSDVFFIHLGNITMDQGRDGWAQRPGLCLTKVSLADGNFPTEKKRHLFMLTLVIPGGVWPRHASTVPNQRCE